MDVSRYVEANRKLWEAWTDVHEKSDFYDIDGFLAGKSRLKPLEREQLLPFAKGKSLLHLQCHFGLDTLSWAREGVKVTGVDFSEKAIVLARSLNERAGLDAAFVKSDVYSLPESLNEQFDVVFTSYGVLNWLPDIDRWAEVCAHFLKPGGIFYIAEFHPIGNMFDDNSNLKEWRLNEPYFYSEQPNEYTSEGSYADRSADIHLKEYEWCHPLGDVVTALINAGLQLEFVHEYPWCTYPQMPFLEEHDEWDWRAPAHLVQVPLMYSIRARKPV
jgi:SAM-dependent methyltransferase